MVVHEFFCYGYMVVAMAWTRSRVAIPNQIWDVYFFFFFFFLRRANHHKNIFQSIFGMQTYTKKDEYQNHVRDQYQSKQDIIDGEAQ